ncbi:hypothetical protein [Arthrobacter sp. NIO-1057]|uniref:hypothetical protein n=1 Tax=Arthrobacter sp. NIO-1057 TaxID=993071 RepID=UPI00071DDC5F|nr:hypothetical protein [Arthrobacter sp. NIO-1057]KSU68061.1 hypothetical protein AS038_02925 [Arthrobacter sp. NIO-1057]
MNALIMAAEASESGLGAHTWSLLIGGSIFVALMILLLITVSYTNVGNRHTVKEEEQDIHRQFKTHEPHSH